MKLNERLDIMIRNVADSLGYIIYDTVLILHGKTPKITVKIDHINGISHVDCERFSKELTRKIDDENILDDYILEVSSPGIKRELRSIEDFIRFKGSPVKGIYQQQDMRKTFKGQLVDVNEQTITIKENNNELVLSYNQIIKANLDY